MFSEASTVIGELFGGREAIGWRAAGETADRLRSPTWIETDRGIGVINQN